LKPGGFKLWVGNCIQLVQPHLALARAEPLLDVAVQVEFESKL
jgi:hypothetical protein